MSTRILYLVAFAGLAPFAMPVAAGAADMVTDYAPAPMAEDLAYDWSGIYAGAHGGVSSGSFPNPFSGKSGWQVGGQVGANFQTGTFVYGAELDGSYSNGTEHNLGGGAALERTWTGAAKARAGVSLDRTLIYGTAGYALTRFEPKGTVTSGRDWKGGFLVGGGIEQAFAGRISAKAEYNYVKFKDVETTVVGGGHRSDDINSHTVKLGLNYRF